MQTPFDKGSISENMKDIFGSKGYSLLPTKPVFTGSGQGVVDEMW